MTDLQKNILIVGAGPAGCTVALALAQKNIACTLVDKATFPRDKICGDALSGKVVAALKKLNPSWVEELRVNVHFLGSYGVLFSSPDGSRLRLPFALNYGADAPAPGFVAKRLDFDNWLVEKVKKQPLITFLENTEIRNYEKSEKGYTCHTTDQQVLEADFVVACDGAYSSFTKNVAQISTEEAHNAFGIRAYYKNVADLDSQNFIELHFINELLPGYFWIFPLPNGEANVGAGIRADYLKSKKVNLKQSLEQLILNHPEFKRRFEHATMIDNVKLFGLPLGSKKRTLYGENYLLVGDAAMLIDPFTGEGIGNAMISGLAAADSIENFFSTNKQEALSEYQATVERKLWSELLLSTRLQQLSNYPRLFNFIVRNASKNKALQATFSAMFYDVNIRAKLKSPLFYIELLFSSLKSRNK